MLRSVDGVRPVRLPPTDPATACLLAAGEALDLVSAALEADTQESWKQAHAVLLEALWLADEARAAKEREEARVASERGWKYCAFCGNWKPLEELNVVQYADENVKKNEPARVWYRCLTHEEGENGELTRQQ